MTLEIEQELEKGKIYAIRGVGDNADPDALSQVAQRVGCGFLLLNEGQSIEEFKDVAVKMAVVAALDEIETSPLPLTDQIELIRDRYQ